MLLVIGAMLALASAVNWAQTLPYRAELPSGDGQPIGFTGYVKDPEAGLYYAGARYYDPAIGRFMTEDPESGSPMNPPSLHRYLYAYANPATYTDSTGRQVDIDDPVLVAKNQGWNEEQTATAVAAHVAAEEFRSGAAYGAGKQVVRGAYGVAAWGARLLAKTFFDVGDPKDIVDPIINGVVGVADAIRSGPNALVEYEAHKSVESEWLMRQGRTVEAGELYGPEVATTAGGVATAGVRLSGLGPFQRGSATIEGVVAETGSGAIALKPTSAAVVAESIGPKIGRSGYESWSEFNGEAYRRYQQYTDEAYDGALRAERSGLLQGNPNTRVGTFVDDVSRARLAAWLKYEGIREGPGGSVQLNRWLRNPAGTGEYVRPDVQLPGAIMDATVGRKSPQSVQLRRNAEYSGGKPTTIVRPSQLGGSCTVIPCRGNE
jgi:RHS repeat-associated protein